jgi:hypothetical protein
VSHYIDTVFAIGTKTVYSWDTDKGGIVSIVKDAKRTSLNLENPLGKFDEQLKLVDEMINSLDILVKDEEKKRKSHDFLTKFSIPAINGLGASC